MPIIDFDVSQLTDYKSQFTRFFADAEGAMSRALQVASEKTLERMKALYAYHDYTGAARSRMVIEPHYKELYADVGLPASVIPMNPGGWYYPIQIEMGSRGPYKRMPPFEPIRAWAMNKLGVGYRDARNIWMAIGTRGTEPYLDFMDMVQDPRFMDILEQELLTAFDRILSRA